MLFWLLNVVNPITAGPKAKRHPAILSKEFQPDHANILFIKNAGPVSTCQNDGKTNMQNPIKNDNGENIKYPHADYLFWTLLLLSKYKAINDNDKIIKIAPTIGSP